MDENDDKDAKSAKEWMQRTGIVVMYPIGTKDGLGKLWKSWQKMPKEDKQKSDATSIKLFGMGNEEHHEILQLLYL